MRLFKHYQWQNKKVWQFIQFCIVGLSNTSIYFFVYYLLLHYNIHYLMANILGWGISVANAYFWSCKYVFRKSKLSHMNSFIRVYLSYALTLLLSTGSLYVLVQYVKVSETIAPWLIYIVTVPMNFVLNKYWVFPE